MHPPGRKPARYLRPQQGRKLEADDAVQETPRLLRVHLVLVDLARFLEGTGDGATGDFVEHHPAIARRIAADHLAQMPGDGLAFAVAVGGEIDVAGAGRGGGEFPHHLFLAGDDLVVGGPAVVRVHAHATHELGTGAAGAVCRLLLRRQFARLRALASTLLGVQLGGAAAGGQVAHVADARLDHVVLAEIAVDGARLRRRFDDDECLRRARRGGCGSGHVLLSFSLRRLTKPRGSRLYAV